MKNPIRQGSMAMLPAGTSEIEITADNYRGGNYELIYQPSGRRSQYPNDGERTITIDPNGGQVSINNMTGTTLYWEKIK